MEGLAASRVGEKQGAGSGRQRTQAGAPRWGVLSQRVRGHCTLLQNRHSGNKAEALRPHDQPWPHPPGARLLKVKTGSKVSASCWVLPKSLGKCCVSDLVENRTHQNLGGRAGGWASAGSAVSSQRRRCGPLPAPPLRSPKERGQPAKRPWPTPSCSQSLIWASAWMCREGPGGSGRWAGPQAGGVGISWKAALVPHHRGTKGVGWFQEGTCVLPRR